MNLLNFSLCAKGKDRRKKKAVSYIDRGREGGMRD